MNRTLKMLVIFVFSFLTVMLLYINVNMSTIVFSTDNIFVEMNNIVSDFDFISIVFGIVIYFFYYQIYFNGEKYTKKNFIMSIISIFFSIITIVGKNLQLYDIFPDLSRLVVLFESSVMFVGSYLLFYSIFKKVYMIICSMNVKKNKKINKNSKLKTNNSFFNKVINFSKNHKFLTLFIILMCFRIPYLIVYYPGITCGDTLDQLCQLHHSSCSWSKDMVHLVNKGVYLNNHHPLFSTLYLGLFVKIGEFINNPRLGLFFYSVIQLIFSSLVFTYIIYYLRKINLPKVLCNILFLVVCIGPHFSAFSLTIFKDAPQAIFTALYVLFLIQIVRDYDSVFNNKLNVFVFISSILFTMLFRNNGLITILLSYPFLFLLYKNNWKKILIVLLVPMIIFVSFNQISYRVFNIPRGSIKEMLSIPFMQVARVVNKKGEDIIAVKDQKIIDKVIKFDGIGERYDTTVADDVKDHYRNDATNEDLKRFFGVWYKYFKKYPTIYMASFINCTYQYFYPYELYQNIFIGFDARITENFSDLYGIRKLDYFREDVEKLFDLIFKLPLIGIFFKVCFYDWFLIFSTCYVIGKKKYKYLIPLSALLAVLLVCLASPINGSMRYILPILFSFPLMVGIDYLVYYESK
ncbi:MAG: hypothetical protein E7160_05170 [Firmicutes bacterium]|nr:hypothetical protein [Bacillota bacterium]